ncbi:MAG: DUF11 domain-containing protein [Chloroflexi bacterium]|nr:DUF11 domain-containing protein [Chloroflexota bacterium]
MSKSKFRVRGSLAVMLAFALIIAFATPIAADSPSVFINEIHYDNDGSDTNEGVEIAGPAGTDLTGWQLVPYNGNGGGQYSPANLSGTIPDQQNGFGTLWVPVDGLQNGSPDGIALVAPGDVVIQFLSYEGDFAATDGPANGMTSTDIGVSEGGSTPEGYSLQLQGIGDSYDDFTWSDPIPHTRDTANTGQTLQEVNAFSISKSAPSTVSPDEVFTYTLVVQNNTGVTPATTTITDMVPDDAAFIVASNGGVESGGLVSWAVDNFADGATITRTFQVMAPGTHGTEIQNVEYGVSGGDDWPTPTMGLTRTTMVVGDCDSIYNIQYPGGDSLCVGEMVTVTGTIYGVYGSDFAMAEAAGAWQGIYVDHSGSYTPTVGHEVQVQGTVEENYGFTRIDYVTHTVLMTGTTPYTPSVISTAEAADGEAYEGVLVEAQDVIVSDEDLGYGEWGVDDGSGQVYVDDAGMGAYTYAPIDGDALDLVRGMLNYSYSNYKIAPRGDNDIVEATGSGLLLDKHAPAFTPPGEAFTYTLTVENQTAQTLGDLWISDTLPLSLTYARSNPAGTWDEASHTITWTESSSITHDSTLTYTLVVTAPAAMTVVSNTDYMAWSSDWLTPTMGEPVETLIRGINTIYELQYTDDPSGDSPYDGQNVATEGIVTARFSDWVFIQDGTGAWNGIVLYKPASYPDIGDHVRVFGTVEEGYDLTRFATKASVTVLSSGNALPEPELLDTGDVAQEQWESVLVRVEDVTVTDDNLGYGEWEIDDGSGPIVVDDLADYNYSPTDDDELGFVQGPLHYSFGAFKIEPRGDADIDFSELTISKNAIAHVGPGDTFTYTLTIENKLGFDMNNVVITDTIPTSTTFAYGLDDGVASNGVVSWALDNIANGETIKVRFVVTVAGNLGDVIVNSDYAIRADNFITPTFGTSVNTFIGDFRIYHAQGEGFVSPYLGQEATVEGVVVADFQAGDEMSGFFMQDPLGDDNPLTSDGIFVYAPGMADIDVGYRVRVTGVVEEEDDLTRLSDISALTVLDTMALVPPATEITLPEPTDGYMERYPKLLPGPLWAGDVGRRRQDVPADQPLSTRKSRGRSAGRRKRAPPVGLG